MSGQPGFDGLEIRALACAAGYRTLFAALDLRVPRSRWVMLLGPNGSGKSTLLRAVAGLARPVDGEIRWRGAVRRPDSPEWRTDCLYQGHTSGWKDSLEARENLVLQAALDGLEVDPARIDAQLARVGLERQAQLPFVRLSAGQRRRLSLARLALSDRPLWLLDEPGTALDTAGLHTLAGLLDEHLQRGGLALVATHQPLPCAQPPLVLDLGAARP